MRAGGYYHYSANRYFLRKKLTSVTARLLLLIICHCRRVILDAVHWTETFVSITFIAMLVTPIARLFNVADMCEKK